METLINRPHNWNKKKERLKSKDKTGYLNKLKISKFVEEDNDGIYQIIDPQFDLDYIAQPDNAIIKFFYQVNSYL